MIIPDSAMKDFMTLIADPTFKGAVAISNDLLAHISKRYRLRSSTLRLLKNERKQSMKGFAFKRNYKDFMFEPINDKMKYLLASGLTDYWVNQYMQIKTMPDDTSPRVINLTDLAIGFLACLVPLALSAVVFFVEIWMKHRVEISRKFWLFVSRL